MNAVAALETVQCADTGWQCMAASWNMLRDNFGKAPARGAEVDRPYGTSSAYQKQMFDDDTGSAGKVGCDTHGS